VLEGRLNSTDPKLQQVKITRFVHSKNVSCESPPTYIGVAGIHTRCQRKGDEAVAITVSAEHDANGEYRVQLPPRAKYFVKDSVYLSDLPTLREENIHGHLWRDHPYWQATLVLDKPYDKGLVTHAPLHGVGYVEYDLRGKGYKRFSAIIGIAKAEKAPLCENPLVAKPVRFSVFVDGRKVYETPENAPFGFNSEPKPLDIDIAGASLLKLQVQAVGSTNTCADSAWADARLTR
jgi:hypothetical protein